MEEETPNLAGSPLGDLLAEDLSPMGLEELSARIDALESEIERCRAIFESKRARTAMQNRFFVNKRMLSR